MSADGTEEHCSRAAEGLLPEAVLKHTRVLPASSPTALASLSVCTALPNGATGRLAARRWQDGAIRKVWNGMSDQLRNHPISMFSRERWWSQVLFGEFAKLIGHGTGNPQRHRRISDRIPSEAIADPVDSAVGRPPRHAFLGAGAAGFIFEPKREFQLNIPVLLEMRHRDRQERDSLLIRVIRKDRAHQLLGDLGKDHGRGDWRVERNRASG